jgi:hypothetical protein
MRQLNEQRNQKEKSLILMMKNWTKNLQNQLKKGTLTTDSNIKKCKKCRKIFDENIRACDHTF